MQSRLTLMLHMLSLIPPFTSLFGQTQISSSAKKTQYVPSYCLHKIKATLVTFMYQKATILKQNPQNAGTCLPMFFLSK